MKNYVLGDEESKVVSFSYGMDRAPHTVPTIVQVGRRVVAPADPSEDFQSVLDRYNAAPVTMVGELQPKECDVFALLDDFAVEDVITGEALPFPRRKRDALLSASDRWGAADYRALQDAGLVAAWDAYRQALRDLPQNAGSHWDVIWPLKPGEEV